VLQNAAVITRSLCVWGGGGGGVQYFGSNLHVCVFVYMCVAENCLSLLSCCLREREREDGGGEAYKKVCINSYWECVSVYDRLPLVLTKMLCVCV